MRVILSLVVATWIMGLVAVRADEAKVPLDKVPEPILQAVKKRFPDAKLVSAAKETEGGKTEFEISLKDKGKKIDVMLTPEGQITTIEKEIALADVPKAVKKIVEQKHPDAKIKRIEEVIKVSKGKEKLESYEFLLETADKKTVEFTVPAHAKKGARKESTPLEPGSSEYKYYAPGVGLVQEGSLRLVKYGPGAR